jgi:hypothetical protein
MSIPAGASLTTRLSGTCQPIAQPHTTNTNRSFLGDDWALGIPDRAMDLLTVAQFLLRLR